MSVDGNETGARAMPSGAVSADAYREEMWTVISRSWSEQTSRRKRARAARLWGAAGVGLAAALVAGVFLGRWSATDDPAERRTASIVDDGSLDRPLAMPYRVAVNEHFRNAETLLVLFESAEDADRELAERARDLAAASRMLMDSRAGRDREIRAILLELELLLVQISRLEDAPTELEIVRSGVEETGALNRMRALMADDMGPLAL